jgi:hypothetical protein
MAVEEGVALVVGQHAGPPVASRYTAVHAYEDGNPVKTNSSSKRIDDRFRVIAAE